MRCNFYAAGNDLHPVLDHVERARDLRYAVAGIHLREMALQNSWRSVLPLHSPDEQCLVLEAQFSVVVRAVPQQSGHTLYAVDELANPSGVTLKPGVTIGPSLLLPGLVGCTAAAGPAASLVRAYKNAFAKHFTRVKAYWVGPYALELLRRGARLTVGAAASTEFDLTEEVPRSV